VQRDALDILHHGAGIMEHMRIDALERVTRALAVLIHGRTPGRIDVATAEGFGAPKASGDPEPIQHRCDIGLGSSVHEQVRSRLIQGWKDINKFENGERIAGNRLP